MPFMPEMFAFCGKRLRVVSSAHKTCDTIANTGGRRVESSVHLEEIRCDGGGHDGCAAGCLIFWKEAWLKPLNGAQAAVGPGVNGSGSGPRKACTEAEVVAAARTDGTDGPRFSCQATDLNQASTLLKWWDFRQYVDDYRSGNVGLRRIALGAAYAIYAGLVRRFKHRPRIKRILMSVYDKFQALRGGVPFPRRFGTIPRGSKTPPCVLDLQPGELVKIKPYREILPTLDEDNKNRGLYFDAEHVRYCGNTYRVRSRVDKIVDEKNGKMLVFKTGSVILDGVTCEAYYSDRRMFCPRAIYPYWREIWLDRVAPAVGVAAGAPPASSTVTAPAAQPAQGASAGVASATPTESSY